MSFRVEPPSSAQQQQQGTSFDGRQLETMGIVAKDDGKTNVNDLYKRTEVIGRGKFGVVYKGYNRKTNQVVAIKVLNLDTDQEEVKDVQQEIQFLSRLKQAPNITHYHGSYLSDTKLWIIMDHCAGGSVRSLLKPGRIEEKYIGVIVRELLVALQYVHRAGVIHRDLKAANVLITRDGNVQLCDFGVAAQLTANALKRTTMAGTPYWMAPEVIMEGAKYDLKVDIWSLGITIYEIATGNPPYSDKDAMRAMQLITKSKPPRLEGRNHSPLLKEIIALCLDENPDERQSADDLLKSRFIKAHRNTPVGILKEIISRYLIWRESRSAKDRVTSIYGMDEEILENNANPNNSTNGESGDNELDVKWDFDSLSSSEYIMENNINVNQISNQPEYGEELYEDDDEYMMTSNQQTYMTGNDHPTSRDDPTLRMTASGTVGHTMGTKRGAPKSLLQLFEEETEISSIPSSLTTIKPDSDFENVPTLPKVASSHIPRSSSPMIEIPSMDEIPVSEPVVETRSRAPTLTHTQSAAAVLARGNEMSETPSVMPRRPTITQIPTPISAPPLPNTGFLNPPASLTQSTSSLSSQMGRTPSPKRSTASSTVENVNLSPQRITGMTPSNSMKPLPTNAGMSALLQPINKIDSDAVPANDLSPTQQTTTVRNKSKNISNLHLKMPAPTSVTASLQSLTNFDPQYQHLQPQSLSAIVQQRSVPSSSSSSPAPRDAAPRINQFGYDPSQALASPLTMTPLNEKSQLSAMNAFLSGGKVTPKNVTSSLTPSRESRSKTVTSSTNGMSLITKETTRRTVFPELPQFQSGLLVDDTENCKQRLVHEVMLLTSKFTSLLEMLEEEFNVYIE